MKKIFLYILVLSVIHPNIFSQEASRDVKPPWINGNMPRINSAKGKYKMINVDANSLQNAKEQAKEELVRDLLTQQGVDIKSTSEYTIDNNSSTSSGDNSSVKYHNVTSIKTKNKEVAFAKIDEYYEYKGETYLFWALYMVSESSTPISKVPQMVYKLDKGAWRSAIIPGWGQFYQKRYGAGAMFLAGEVALLSTGFFFRSRYISNDLKSQEASKVKFKQEYRNRANKYKTYSYISLGAAAGWYIYNIVDAFTSKKGKLEYDYGKMNFAFYPILTPGLLDNSMCTMATLSIRFNK